MSERLAIGEALIAMQLTAVPGRSVPSSPRPRRLPLRLASFAPLRSALTSQRRVVVAHDR
eukprot:3295822-Pleurochrysis_carterae.AAC.1